MSLKDKLERLRSTRALGASPLGGAGGAPSSAGPAGSGAGTAPNLDELRLRMQAILDVPLAPERARVAPRFEDLGFRELENRLGRFWHRREVLRPSLRVGRSTLLDAAEARTLPLALLALDPSLAVLDLRDALYLDTETTGLGGGAGTYAFLIGLSSFEGGQTIFEQLLLEGPEQEAAALLEIEARVQRATLLVSYNGKAFDWPLLKTRFVYNRMTAPRDKPHLDLLHVARRVHGRRIGRCSLKDVERSVLGFERAGDIEGALVAASYAHYQRSGDSSGLGQVIDHNAMDVRSLSALVALYGDENPALHAVDLAEVSRTFRRAKDLGRAEQVASEAIVRGGGAGALRARAEVNKALGERLLALRDFEAAEAEQADPEVRLELVKLYEHYAKDPVRALEVLQRGTGESVEQVGRRAARLSKKAERAGRPRTTRAKSGRIC